MSISRTLIVLVVGLTPTAAMTQTTPPAAQPPAKPAECIFANTTRTITADLKSRVSPCQFGGNPDCSQCGCIASAGLNSIGKMKLPGGISVGWLYEQSLLVGTRVAAMRGD